MKPPKPPYTEKQGQYLTFIHRYTKTRGYPPSEPDIQMHFGVSAPTIHQMIVRLEACGLIEKTPYTARSIRILLPEDQMPGAVAARAAAEIPPPGTSKTKAPYTVKQGQYLAFIHHYTKVHRYPPAESDIQMYFGVTAPSVHLMIVKLTERGFIDRIPYTPRSIRVLLPPDLLPLLE
jgi:Mn-dependent DtxR family transcriptional regulator